MNCANVSRELHVGFDSGYLSRQEVCSGLDFVGKTEWISLVANEGVCNQSMSGY